MTQAPGETILPNWRTIKAILTIGRMAKTPRAHLTKGLTPSARKAIIFCKSRMSSPIYLKLLELLLQENVKKRLTLKTTFFADPLV